MPTPGNDEPLIRFLEHELARAGYDGTYSAGKWHVVPVAEAVAVPLDMPEGSPGEQTAKLLRWLESQRRRAEGIPIAIPKNDVRGVHELAERLYAPYEVREGIVRLGGCQLLHRLVVRVTFLRSTEPRGAVDSSAGVHHWFLDEAGKPFDASVLQHFDFAHLVAGPRGAAPGPEFDLRRVEDAADRLARDAWGEEPRRLWSTVIALKWVEGKLEFAIDDATASVGFRGWASGYRDGWLAPPPFVCPATGKSGFVLERTDERQVTVPEAIGVCEVTGRRLLETRLGRSAVSGRRAALDRLVECPVSHEMLLTEEQVACTMCLQPVSPLVVVRGRCRACRTAARVPADDPRIVRLTDEWSFWRRDRRWFLAETKTVYIVVCRRWMEDWLVVLDKPALTLRRLARRGRFTRRWRDVDPAHVTTGED